MNDSNAVRAMGLLIGRVSTAILAVADAMDSGDESAGAQACKDMLACMVAATQMDGVIAAGLDRAMANQIASLMGSSMGERPHAPEPPPVGAMTVEEIDRLAAENARG